MMEGSSGSEINSTDHYFSSCRIIELRSRRLPYRWYLCLLAYPIAQQARIKYTECNILHIALSTIDNNTHQMLDVPVDQ